MGIIALALFIIWIIFIIKKNKENKKKQNETIIYDIPQENIPQETIVLETQELPYEKSYLLTKNEWYFHKKLKPIADQLGYTILAKIRLADLVRVKGNISYYDQQRYFAKIRAKHIDFALCDPENLLPLLIIELDDASHKKEDRIERDNFVNDVLKKAGYKILRTNGTNNLENEIRTLLTPQAPQEQK